MKQKFQKQNILSAYSSNENNKSAYSSNENNESAHSSTVEVSWAKAAQHHLINSVRPFGHI